VRKRFRPARAPLSRPKHLDLVYVDELELLSIGRTARRAVPTSYCGGLMQPHGLLLPPVRWLRAAPSADAGWAMAAHPWR
jgi:hypothetical protein